MEFLHVLQELRTPFGEAFFQAITWLGEELLVMAVLGILYWCVNKDFAYRLAFGFFLSGLVVQAMKVTFRVPRPWLRDPSLQPVGTAVEAATGYSFPSGHTQTGTSLYGTALCKAKNGWLRLLFAVIIILLGFSRMYLGVHTPADVLVAAGVTLFLTVLVNVAYDNGYFEKHRKAVAGIVYGLSLLLLVYALCLYTQGVVPYDKIADCVKAAAAGIAFGIGWYLETTRVNFPTRTAVWWQQIVKLLVGLVVTLALKSGLKLLFGEILVVDGIRYFLTVLWVTYLYPLLIVKVLAK